MAIQTEGEDQTRAERSRRGTWFVVGMVALLVGYPLGFFFVAGGAPDWTFAILYALLVAIAIGAAFAFTRMGGRRERGRSV